MPYDPNSPAARAGLEYDPATNSYRVPGWRQADAAAGRSHHSHTEQDLAALKGTPAAIASAWKDYRAEVAAATSPQARARYMPAVLQAKLQDARTKVEATLQQIEQDSRAAHERLNAAAESARGKSANHGDPARAVNEQRAWERARAVIERSTSSGERLERTQQLIADAGREGDLATLRVLAQELPAYLEAHESKELRTIRRAVGQGFAEHEKSGAELRLLQRDLAKASAPHLSAEERSALEIAEAVKPVEWAIAPNLQMVRAALRSGEQRLPTLFGWEQKSLVEVDGTPTREQLAEEREQRLQQYQQQALQNRPTHQQQLRAAAMREMRQAPDAATEGGAS